MLTNYLKFNRNILYNSQLRGCITLPIACLFIYIFGVYIGLSSNSSECRVCVFYFSTFLSNSNTKIKRKKPKQKRILFGRSSQMLYANACKKIIRLSSIYGIVISSST